MTVNGLIFTVKLFKNLITKYQSHLRQFFFKSDLTFISTVYYTVNYKTLYLVWKLKIKYSKLPLLILLLITLYLQTLRLRLRGNNRYQTKKNKSQVLDLPTILQYQTWPCWPLCWADVNWDIYVDDVTGVTPRECRMTWIAALTFSCLKLSFSILFLLCLQ